MSQIKLSVPTETQSLCLQGVLIGNHLPTEDLQDIVLYSRFHCLFTTSEQQRLAQLVIWREVGHEILLSHGLCISLCIGLVDHSPECALLYCTQGWTNTRAVRN